MRQKTIYILFVIITLLSCGMKEKNVASNLKKTNVTSNSLFPVLVERNLA